MLLTFIRAMRSTTPSLGTTPCNTALIELLCETEGRWEAGEVGRFERLDSLKTKERGGAPPRWTQLAGVETWFAQLMTNWSSPHADDH